MGSVFKYQFKDQQKWTDARIIFDTGTTVNYLVSEVYVPIKKYVSAKTPTFCRKLANCHYYSYVDDDAIV